MNNKAKLLLVFTLLILMFAFTGCSPDQSYTSGADSNALHQEDNSEATADIEDLPQFREEVRLQEHYQKHVIDQNEFGDITIDEYLKSAQDFVLSKDEDVLTKKEEDGDCMFYKEATNEFAILSTDGYIRTYFKPSRGIDYFNQQ